MEEAGRGRWKKFTAEAGRSSPRWVEEVERGTHIKRFEQTAISEFRARLYVALLIMACIIFFIAIYPLAKSGILGGGSDNDDAFNIAARALLAGKYPYNQLTYLGGKIAYLPGAILLSIPAVIIYSAAVQNILWLVLLCIHLRIMLKNWKDILLILLTPILFCPTFLQVLANGSDLIASGAYIFIALTFFVETMKNNRSGILKGVALFFLGLTLSSRLPYLFYLPLIAGFLAREKNWRISGCYLLGVLAVFLLITLPFYLHSPNDFAPLTAQSSKLSCYNQIIPHVDFLIVGLTFAISIGLAFRKNANQPVAFLIYCSIVQAFPLVAAVVLSSLQTKSIVLNAGVYFFHFLFCSMVAAVLILRSWSTAETMPRSHTLRNSTA